MLDLFRIPHMTTIRLSEHIGHFAENKDLAQELRKDRIVPALERNEDVVLDFEGIESATQSFIHALISDLIRHYGSEVLNKVLFKNCNNTVQKIIGIVVDYMQQRD